MFREVVRRFMRDELAPQQKAFEEAGQPSREMWRALGKMVCYYKEKTKDIGRYKTEDIRH